MEGRFNGGFLHYRFRGLIFGGAYFRNFTVHGNEFKTAAKEKQKLTKIKNDRYKGGASEYHLAWALVKILTGRKGKEVPATLQSGMSRVRPLGVRPILMVLKNAGK